MSLLRRALASTLLPVGVAATPIVWATARALHRGWLPMGDNAYFAIRARDVLTEHHPLLGAWSSGSDAVGIDVNNLGPVQLDLLAPFVRAFGFGPGTAIGVAAVNVAAVVVVVLLSRRRLGPTGAWLGATMATTTAWTLGSELLFEPRQHHALVLPFLAFLAAAWSLAVGDRLALPVTAGIASLVVQTHLTFILPVLALSLIALAGAGITSWTAGRGERWWRPWRGAAAVTAMVLVVCWAQPVIEELQQGQGNLSAAREAAGEASDAFGLAAGARAVATVLGPPDGWWRSSFRTFDPVHGLTSPVAATSILVVTVALLLSLAAWSARRGGRAVTGWLATALAAVAVSVAAAATSPTSGPFGAVSGNFRFLWPVAVFTTFGVIAAALCGSPPRLQRVGRALLCVVTIAFGVAALPTSYQSPGPEADAPLIPVARSLRQQLLARQLPEPVAVDRSGLFFGEPYTYVALAALQELGVELVLDAPTDVARFGDERRRDGPVAGTITFATGLEALGDRPGAVLLARASLLTVEEVDRVRREAAGAHERSEALARGTVAVWFEPSG